MGNDYLDERRKKYDIPPITAQPTFDKVAVWRLKGAEEERTAGGLYVPDTAKDVDNRGVVLALGLGAMDKAADHDIRVGDIVWFGRFTGDEREISRDAGALGKQVLTIEIGAITNNEDTARRLNDGSLRVTMTDDDKFIYEENAR